MIHYKQVEIIIDFNIFAKVISYMVVRYHDIFNSIVIDQDLFFISEF